jgi:DNA-binding NtrC family response regulator
VTLDLNLAGHSSIDLIKRIKELRREIEILVITAYESLEDAREANQSGAGWFISKPFNAPDIIVGVAKSFEMRSYNMKIRSMAEKTKSLRSSHNDNADISTAS